MKITPILVLVALVMTARAEEKSGDVVVYGGSPAGVMAAVAAARDGARVVLISESQHLGGIIANGGLCNSDLGVEPGTIGGLGLDFFRRVYRYYVDTYGKDSRQVSFARKQDFPGGKFEPHVAEKIFEDMVRETPGIEILRGYSLKSAKCGDGRIFSADFVQDGGETVGVTGKEFIDASYTGDLMAAAGVEYHVGREGRDVYRESLAPAAGDKAIQAYNYRITITDDPKNLVPFPKPENYDPDRYRHCLEALEKSRTAFDEGLARLPNSKLDANEADQSGVSWEYPEASPATRRRIEQDQRDYSLGYLYFLQNDPGVPGNLQADARRWGLPRDEFADNGHFPRAIYVRVARRMIGEKVMTQADLTTERSKEDGVFLGSYAIDSHAPIVKESSDGRRQAIGGMYHPVQPYAVSYHSLTPKAGQCTNLLVPVCLSASNVAYSSIRMEPVYMMAGEASGVAAAIAAKTGEAVQKIDVGELREKLREQGAIVDLPAVPVSKFTWQPENPKPGETVAFTLARQDGEIGSVDWDFDGNGISDATGSSASWTFPQAKEALVSAFVRIKNGTVSAVEQQLVKVGDASGGDAFLDAEEESVAKTKLRFEPYPLKQPKYGAYFHHDYMRPKGECSAVYRPPLTARGRYAVYISTTPKPGRNVEVAVTVQSGGKEVVFMVDRPLPENAFNLTKVAEVEIDPSIPGDGVVTLSNKDTLKVVVFDTVRWILLERK